MAAELLEGSTECRLLWFWFYHGLRLAEQSNWQVIVWFWFYDTRLKITLTNQTKLH